MSTTALVTGASAGIGRELARLLAADGHDLVLVARRRDRLEELAADLSRASGVRANALSADLSDPAAPRRLVDELGARGLEIEVLVNNAGFGANGAFVELPAARQLEMVQVNVTALVELTRLLLPAMIARGRGRILNLGSTAGFQPGPFMAVYYASKAFVGSFSEALAEELRGTGVTVTLSCPGPTDTEFGAIAGNDKSRLFGLGAMSAVEVARHAYQALRRGRTVAVPGLRNKAGVQAVRFGPRLAIRRIAAALNRAGKTESSPD
jgi:uncharacterized protein